MLIFRFLRRHPITLLGLLVATFATWVLWDARFAPRGPRVAQIPQGDGDPDPPEQGLRLAESPSVRRLPRPPGVKANPQDTAQLLPKLKPGMSRTEVEGLVGLPAAENVHPALVNDGKVTYFTAYEADLVAPATVRPTVRPTRTSARAIPPTRPLPRPNAQALVALEFDASKPGHPLLRVHYPDPLF